MRAAAVCDTIPLFSRAADSLLVTGGQSVVAAVLELDEARVLPNSTRAFRVEQATSAEEERSSRTRGFSLSFGARRVFPRSRRVPLGFPAAVADEPSCGRAAGGRGEREQVGVGARRRGRGSVERGQVAGRVWACVERAGCVRQPSVGVSELPR